MFRPKQENSYPFVIAAKAGIHAFRGMDSCLYRNDRQNLGPFNFINGLRTIGLLLALLLFLLIGAAACGPTPDLPTEIRIGVIAPLSGEAPGIGEATVWAAELAVHAVNEAGGLQVGETRYPLVLVVEDSKNIPDTAVTAARKLINQDNVIVLIGPQTSRNAIPVATIAENAGIPMISPYSTNPATTAGKRYVFRVPFVDSFQGAVLAHFALDDLDVQTAAVLYDIANDYNRDIAEFFQSAFVEGGGEIVAFEAYTTGAEEYDVQLAHIREAQPQVIFLPNYVYEVPFQVEEIRRAGIDAIILGSDSWDGVVFATNPAFDGAFFSAHFAPDDADALKMDFVNAYQAAYGQTPNDIAALTYDAFGLLFEAIRNQGEVNPEAIRDGLGGIERYEGVTGTMTYSGSGDPAKSVNILRLKDGEPQFYQAALP